MKQLTDAVARLQEALAKPKDEYMRDSCIQRFEFTFDLSWKTVKAYLEETLNVRCASPTACFREAYSQGLVEYEDRWISMAQDHNQTAHMYKESLAEEVYRRLPAYLKLFQELLGKLQRGQE